MNILNQLDPTGRLQSQIDDNQVRFRLLNGLECLMTVVCFSAHNQVALAIDIFGKAFADDRVIVHQKDACPFHESSLNF